MPFRLTTASIVLMLSAATTACSDAASNEPQGYSTGLEEFILPKEKLTKMEVSAAAGNPDAAYEIASHYGYSYLLNNNKNDKLNYIKWLAKAISMGSREGMLDIYYTHLSTGDCKAAADFYSQHKSVLARNGSAARFDKEIGDCYDRPVGSGDSATRKFSSSPM